MQKTKTIQIGQRSFTLKELSVRVVRDLVGSMDDANESMLDSCQKLLKLGCPELDFEVLLDMYPSEIEELWKGFEEVNASFLGIVRLVGMDQALIGAAKEAVTTSIGQFASLLHQGTAQQFGTTGTVSS